MIAPALIPFVVIALLYYQASEAEGCHLSCDFDKNLCEYEQPTDDDADWTRIQGETRSSGTGPSSDHTSGDGWYVYFEASNPRKEGDFADLRGPVVKSNSSSEECVTFYYHMRGIGMGSLKVLTYKKKRGVVSFKEIWKIEGQQSRNGTDWKRAKISIKETAPYQLVFRATRGSRFLSDVGLDDIGMSHKACETPCPGLSQVPNGRVVMSSSQPYKVGTEAVWTCNSGYSLRGYRKAICLESGRWSAGLPSCEAPTCLRDPSKLEPDRRCGTRCQGNGSSGCRVLPNVCRCDGWCGMSCLNPNRECPLLSNPEHGSVTLKGRKYGQTARYKCDPGFSLVGPSERSCRSDRKWSGVAPLCFPYGACGLTEETKAVRKIIRGSDARQGAWPWHALLADIRGNGLVTGVFWGGSLIGKKWVLSAATSFACLTKGGKKGGKKKIVDPFSKKDWYDVKAPAMFKQRQIGKTLVSRTVGTKIASDGLKGRVFECNQADLHGDESTYRKMRLIVEEVQGKHCLTNFHGMSLTRDKLCSMVKKWQTLIEANIDLATTDGYKVRLFCIGFTHRRNNQIKKTSYAQHQQIRNIRRKMVDIMTREVTTSDLREFVNKLIPDSIAKDIEKACQGIYPLHDVHIRKVKILKKPKFDIGRLMELHGEGKGAKSAANEEGGDTGTKVSRADGFEPPVQETV